jgi:hypothetical protein
VLAVLASFGARPRLGRWVRGHRFDLGHERTREDLEAAVLSWIFRALFLLYGDGADV